MMGASFRKKPILLQGRMEKQKEIRLLMIFNHKVISLPKSGPSLLRKKYFLFIVYLVLVEFSLIWNDVTFCHNYNQFCCCHLKYTRTRKKLIISEAGEMESTYSLGHCIQRAAGLLAHSFPTELMTMFCYNKPTLILKLVTVYSGWSDSIHVLELG